MELKNNKVVASPEQNQKINPNGKQVYPWIIRKQLLQQQKDRFKNKYKDKGVVLLDNRNKSFDNFENSENQRAEGEDIEPCQLDPFSNKNELGLTMPIKSKVFKQRDRIESKLSNSNLRPLE